MLFELGLPGCDTVLFNAKVSFTDSHSRCDNGSCFPFLSFFNMLLFDDSIFMCHYCGIISMLCVSVYINVYFLSCYFLLILCFTVFSVDLVV